MASTYTPVEVLKLAVQDAIALVPNRTYKTLSILSKQEDYQTAIKWPVNVGGGTVAGRATDAASRVSVSSDTIVGASLPIGNSVLGHSFDIVRNDIVQASNTAPGALRNLFMYEARTGVEIVLKKLNQAIYAGTGINADGGVYGLEYVGTALNDYAGVSVTTYPTWVPYINTNASNRALTDTLLSAVLIGLQNAGGYADIIMCKPELVETYKKLFATNRTLMAPSAGGADLGFADVSYNGIPIVGDVDCTANTFYFINSRDISVHTFNLQNSSPDNSATPEAEKMEGLNFMVAQVASTNPHVLSFEVSVQPQLQVFNRAKSMAVLGKVTY